MPLPFHQKISIDKFHNQANDIGKRRVKNLSKENSDQFQISLEAVKKAGELSRIKLSEEEAVDFQKQISDALASFGKIRELDVEGVEPLVAPIEQPIQTREDVAESHSEVDEILEQAPDIQGRLFRVPPVV